MAPLDDLWPLYRLRLGVGDIELHLPDESELAALANLTLEPIHDPAVMPFSVPWTDLPAAERAHGTLQWHWKARAEWSPADWRLELVAKRDRVVVGSQALHGSQFSAGREVGSGSWVGRQFQGSGVATAMRRAILHLSFAGLGAHSARSSAFADNGASLRVSEKLGYVRDGTETHVRRGLPTSIIRLLLTREAWDASSTRGAPVTVEGLEPCLLLFGVEPSSDPRLIC